MNVLAQVLTEIESNYLQAFIIILICPFNIIYKSSRYRLLSVLRNIILSPLYKVVMLDFFMADQLCSQVKAQTCLCYCTYELILKILTTDSPILLVDVSDTGA